MRAKPVRLPRPPKQRWASRWALLVVVCGLLAARDAPARELVASRTSAEPLLAAAAREARLPAWAAALPALDVSSVNTGAVAHLRLYDPSGDVDDDARASLERVAAGRDGEPHPLAPRVEQLLFKAAYHFAAAPIVVVSAWRGHAGKHTAGEAIDFKLKGIPASKIAAYLRGLSRVGVGIYTHPSTQFVHIDVRDPSYHWVDGSASGARGRERQLADRTSAKRDAAYAAEMDLPIER